MKRFGALLKGAAICVLSITLLTGCEKKPPASAPVSKYTPEIENALSLGNAASSYDTRNQIMLNAVSKARTITDIVALSQAAANYDVRDQIILAGVPLAQSTADFIKLRDNASKYAIQNQIMVTAAEKCTSVDDLLKIVDNINTYDLKDKILVSRVDLAKSVDDYKRLASAAHAYKVRDQLLSMAATKYAVNTPAPANNGKVMALVASPNSGNQSLQNAYEAMLKAQKAYTDAVSKGADVQTIQTLNSTYLEKKKAYDALKL